VNINYKDLIERVGWTAIQAFAASALVVGFTDLDSLKISGAAAGIAVLKVLVAQNIGDRGSGDAIPGGVK
jgi:hypothetical protein